MSRMQTTLSVLRCMVVLVLCQGQELFISTNVSSDLKKEIFQMKSRSIRDIGAATWPEIEEIKLDVTNRHPRAMEAELASMMIQNFWRNYGKSSNENRDSNSNLEDHTNDLINHDIDALEEVPNNTVEKNNEGLAVTNNDPNNVESSLNTASFRYSTEDRITVGDRVVHQQPPEEFMYTDITGDSNSNSAGIQEFSQHFPSHVTSPSPFTTPYIKGFGNYGHNQGAIFTNGPYQYRQAVHPLGTYYIPNNMVYQQYRLPLQVPIPLHTMQTNENVKNFQTSTNLPAVVIPAYHNPNYPTSHPWSVPQPTYGDAHLNPSIYRTVVPSSIVTNRRPVVSSVPTYPYAIAA